MSTRAALAAGTALSAAVTSAWAWMASAAIGPVPPLRLGRNLVSDYAQLAAAPAGNGWELFAAVAVIYALCLLVSGWRRSRAQARAGRSDDPDGRGGA
jgi:hypothetical protein